VTGMIAYRGDSCLDSQADKSFRHHDRGSVGVEGSVMHSLCQPAAIAGAMWRDLAQPNSGSAKMPKNKTENSLGAFSNNERATGLPAERVGVEGVGITKPNAIVAIAAEISSTGECDSLGAIAAVRELRLPLLICSHFASICRLL
jgi:hypothetical protein